MKRVTLLDNAAGNALGWNPGPEPPVITQFTISEPAISTFDQVFVIIEVINDPFLAPVNHQCDVVSHSGSGDTFTIICETPPPDNSELHYVVGNLPAHLIL